MNKNKVLENVQPAADGRTMAALSPAGAISDGRFSGAALDLKPICVAVMLMGSLVSMTGAKAQDDTVNVAPVVVTPTRVEQSSFDLPVSIDAFDKEEIQTAQPQVNLSETLIKAPGVVANNRQNYAQDLQISIRGFGARATFGVRGIRLIADGIPLTMPDGQGQTSSIDLGTHSGSKFCEGRFQAFTVTLRAA